MKNILKSLSKKWRSLKLKTRGGYRRVLTVIRHRPLTSFFVVLGILLLLIIASSFLTPNAIDQIDTEVAKPVDIYKIGESPKVTLQAKIEKSGVIKISALAPGVIQSIKYKEGDFVAKGAVLVNMSSNYQGGNAASLQRQLAGKQYQNAKDTLGTQKEIIQRQRDIASKSDDNAAQLRDITNQSLQESRDLINFNQSLLDTLGQNQTNLENNNPGGVNDATILQIRAQRAQVQAGLNQLRQGLRLSEFQGSNDKLPAELTRIQKDIALKQLDIQQKALDIGLEVSRLQLALAQVNEALYFPASPFSARVQRVHVKEGQSVNPGTPLMTISAIEDPISAIVSLPQNLASSVSTFEPSNLYVGDQIIQLAPTFISTEATDGVLYSIIYIIPDQYSPLLIEGGSISIDIPVGVSTSTVSAVPFIPLDSVYQTSDQSIVLVVDNDRAVSKNIELGNVFGRFVEVKSGLTLDDKVILNRNILSGDKIEVHD